MARYDCVRLLLAFTLLLTVSNLSIADEQAVEADKANPGAEREAQFAEMLTGTSLTGHFTITGKQPAEGPPKLMTERYDLIEVRKIDDRHWLFKARIRYGQHDVTLPMTLPVEWAGDTPVVVVDNIGFPGLGSYSARVLFHKDHYAGHWSGTNHGGHLFGTIKQLQAERTVDSEKSSEE